MNTVKHARTQDGPHPQIFLHVLVVKMRKSKTAQKQGPVLFEQVSFSYPVGFPCRAISSFYGVEDATIPPAFHQYKVRAGTNGMVTKRHLFQHQTGRTTLWLYVVQQSTFINSNNQVVSTNDGGQGWVQSQCLDIGERPVGATKVLLMKPQPPENTEVTAIGTSRITRPITTLLTILRFKQEGLGLSFISCLVQ